MSREKLRKFSELSAFANVYENRNAEQPGLTDCNGESIDLKGKWNPSHFKNSQPITLELACGRGEYSLGLSRMFPHRNFIGLDIKGARLWQGAQIALTEGLTNVAFLRTRIEQIELFFAQNEVDEIWITFPDPFLRESKTNRRLTSPPFLKRYTNFLKPNAVIHLKTDDDTLYQFTLDSIAETGAILLYADDDIYDKPLPMPELELKTYYEKMHLSKQKKIKYIKFELADQKKENT